MARPIKKLTPPNRECLLLSGPSWLYLRILANSTRLDHLPRMAPIDLVKDSHAALAPC